MNIEKIAFVNSEYMDKGVNDRHTAANNLSFPNLGILTIATHIKNNIPAIDIKLFDAEPYGTEKIKIELKERSPV